MPPSGELLPGRGGVPWRPRRPRALARRRIKARASGLKRRLPCRRRPAGNRGRPFVGRGAVLWQGRRCSDRGGQRRPPRVLRNLGKCTPLPARVGPQDPARCVRPRLAHRPRGDPRAYTFFVVERRITACEEVDKLRGAALRLARQAKERTYPELCRSARSRLTVLALEVGSRWSAEAAGFVRQLAAAGRGPRLQPPGAQPPPHTRSGGLPSSRLQPRAHFVPASSHSLLRTLAMSMETSHSSAMFWQTARPLLPLPAACRDRATARST